MCSKTPPLRPLLTPHIWPFLKSGCRLEWTATLRSHLPGRGRAVAVPTHAQSWPRAVYTGSSFVELLLVLYMTGGICHLIRSQWEYPYRNEILLALKQKSYCVHEKEGISTAGSKFDISGANVHCWRNDWNPTFSFTATTGKIQVVETVFICRWDTCRSPSASPMPSNTTEGRRNNPSLRQCKWEARLSITQDCFWGMVS